MEKRTWLFIIFWHMMMSCVCARNLHFSHSHVLLNQGQILQSPQSPSAMQEGVGSRAKEEEVLSRLGSRPPRCDHKCKGCAPCSPIQVPTAHFGPQYTNYEPEGYFLSFSYGHFPQRFRFTYGSSSIHALVFIGLEAAVQTHQLNFQILFLNLTEILLLLHYFMQIECYYFSCYCQILQSPQSPSAMQEGVGSRAKEEEVLSRLGSRPPRCEHKCKGCAPCSPIQVPTAHFGPQYTNYEPEGWKCRCGSILFNP
ncbi:hypothetical protein CTI12_AA335740 [Artemisia annua]|uniref:Epidermal patterning factor-like protein n=1 Tax=Artemisia annua TaxID=35608 RepID=A0A2U1MVK9_ARTAN|nr:hypothetical protein CTI12_AA335740 [Artemisia annua]